MSDKIKIDPENLDTMSAIMENATDAMDEAVQLMLQIVSHRDWTCRERYSINDKIQEIQKAVKIILEWGSKFSKTVRQVLKRLKDKESRISGIFETIDSIIGRIIGIKPSTIVEAGKDIFDKINGNRDSTGTPATDSTWEGIGRAAQEVLQAPGLVDWPSTRPDSTLPTIESVINNLPSVAEPISTVEFGSLEL